MKLFFYWFGGWFTMATIGVIVSVAGLGLDVYGMSQQKKASDQAAQVDTAVADYNAKYDIAAAQQLDLDTIENIDTERQDAKVYLSRQEASYAAAGVLTTTGSPLHAMITNAGRFEQKIQQDYVNSQQKQASYYAAAKVGQLEGSAQAQADRLGGTIALLNGGANIAGTLASDYDKGLFSFGGGPDDGTPGMVG